MEVEMQVPVDPHYVVAVGKMHHLVDVACKVVNDICDRYCDNSCLVAGCLLGCNLLDCSINLVDSRYFGYYFLDFFSVFSSN